jgi:hypothetical protein
MFSAIKMLITRKEGWWEIRPPCPGGFDYLDATATNQCSIYYASSNFRQNQTPYKEVLKPPTGWISQVGPNLGDPVYFYTVYPNTWDNGAPEQIPIYWGDGDRDRNIIVNVYRMWETIYCGENEYGPYYMGNYGCLNFPIYCCGHLNANGTAAGTRCVMQGPPSTATQQFFCQGNDLAYTSNGTLK